MGVLRTLGDREAAERARAWLERSGLTVALRATDEGLWALEVPAGQHERAEGILGAVAGVGHLADLPATARWQRIVTWENAATLFALAMGLLLAVWFSVIFGGLLRWVGVGGAVGLCVAVVAYVAFSGFSAANENPEPVSRGHGVITQDEAAIVSYRRAWIRQTWGLINWRKKVRESRGLAPESTPETMATGAPAPSPRRIPASLIFCHRCERLVDAGLERCPCCGAPRPGRP